MKNGTIHYRNIHKFLFVVKLEDESYSVFETLNVNAFSLGDTISGYLDKCGIYEVLNASTQKYQFILIQKVGCTEATAIQEANLI